MPYINGVYVPKTETITRNVEEFLGPLDPAFDYRRAACEAAARMSPKPDLEKMVLQWKNYLTCAQAGAQVTDDGGWPRMFWYDVLDVGMAATWPYWKPRPTVIVASQYGAKWMDFTTITGIQVKQ